MGNAAITERLIEIARQAETLGHGKKTAYLSEQAAALGWSMDKLYQQLKKVTVKNHVNAVPMRATVPSHTKRRN